MLPEQIHHKCILFSALDWGLGHVMRSIPLLQQLQAQENIMYVACNAQQKELFESALERVNYLEMEGYNFHFRGKGNFGTDMLLSFFKLNRRLKKDRYQATEWVKEYNIDIVLSDQRLGFYSKEVKSILLSHQLTLVLPFHLRLFNIYYHHYLTKFDIVWVPDARNENERITGKMSHFSHKNIHFIGFLSRFSAKSEQKHTFKYGAIVSGPAPYNQQLFELVVKRLSLLNEPSFVLSTFAENRQLGSVQIIQYTTASEMEQYVQQAEVIISRAGYSTIMDLKTLRKPAILIPTPGQYEQLYLAEQLKSHSGYLILTEKAFQSRETL